MTVSSIVVCEAILVGSAMSCARVGLDGALGVAVGERCGTVHAEVADGYVRCSIGEHLGSSLPVGVNVANPGILESYRSMREHISSSIMITSLAASSRRFHPYHILWHLPTTYI